MKSISKITIALIIALILISCDEDSGTNSPNGYRETGDRIKSVTYNYNFESKLNFKYRSDGAIDTIFHIVSMNLPNDIIVITPKYVDSDTIYEFREYDNNGDIIDIPYSIITIAWDGNVKTITKEYEDFRINNLEGLTNTITYDGDKIISRKIEETNFINEYNYLYNDTVDINHTLTILSDTNEIFEYDYKTLLSEIPNPLALLAELGILSGYEFNYELYSPYLITTFKERTTYTNPDTEEIITNWATKFDKSFEFSSKGNLTKITFGDNPDYINRHISIEWEEVE